MDEEEISQTLSDAESILELFQLAKNWVSNADHEKVIDTISCLQSQLSHLRTLPASFASVDARRQYIRGMQGLVDCVKKARGLWPRIKKNVPATPAADVMHHFSSRTQLSQQTMQPSEFKVNVRPRLQQQPIKFFYSFAAKDKEYLETLESHLKPLEEIELMKGWGRHKLSPGKDREAEIRKHFDEADVILLLTSADYFGDEYEEMKQVLERRKSGITVIPILLRAYDILSTPLAGLQPLPRNHVAITSWPKTDSAFASVAQSIREVIELLRPGDDSTSPSRENPMPSPKPNALTSSRLETRHSVPAPTEQTIRCDVLLVTAKAEETQPLIRACQRVAGHSFKPVPIGNGVYYNLGTIEGVRTFLVETAQGNQGPGGSFLTVHEAIQHLKPSAVILVGVAFGMHIKDQKMGDILVSEQILVYEEQRIDEDSNGTICILQRGDRPHASQRLLSVVNMSRVNWRGSKVHLGLMFSGDKVANSITFRNLLQQFEPEGIGGEMEGAGLYAAAERNHVDWIIIKSISDWADGEMSNDKSERQKRAARSATNFVMRILRQGGLIRSSY